MFTFPRLCSPVLFALAPLATAQVYDFIPNTPEVVLDTSVCTVQTANGPLQTFYGGVFVFRDIVIPAGVTVNGLGPNPLILLATRNVIIGGLLSARGGDGQSVHTLNAANFPAVGGRGGAGAGDGGDGSPQTAQRSSSGAGGIGPGALPIGGAGGLLWSAATSGRGSGGGGGSFATQGDPWLLPGVTIIPQLAGIGGSGGLGASGAATRTLPGGAPGISPFTDADDNNNFFGFGYDVFHRRVVVGELPFPTGGQGGGGGGDLAIGPASNWINDARGGGGGGGGGGIVVYAQGFLAVSATGRITADGGRGGGGEQAGSSNSGGGGGGGSGGMVVLASKLAIVLMVKGETLANNDLSFVVSADGGVGTLSPFGPWVSFKYPANLAAAQTYDAAPTGGLGGSGIVQLMAPPGTNGDATNTVLDDCILVVKNDRLLLGAQKQRYLAWRGFKDQNGTWVDDFGNPTHITNNLGDIVPAPVLLPLF